MSTTQRLDETLREGLEQHVLFLQDMLSSLTDADDEPPIQVCIQCYSPDRCECNDTRWPISQAIEKLKSEILNGST